MRSGNLVPGPGFPLFINGGHSLIGGADYDKVIAQLELLMVLLALFARPGMFRAKRGVWYIDNTAALMCLFRGRSA